MLLPDHEIRKRCVNPVFYHEGNPLLAPFSEGVQGDGIISYGLSHAGYDLRMAEEVWVFKNVKGMAVDPKRFKGNPEEVLKYQSDLFEVYKADGPVTLPAHGYCLVRSVEYFSMPLDLMGTCTGKSTYARCGLIVNTTPIEPGWRGHLTVEISNSNPSNAVIYPLEGIAQVTFSLLYSRPEKCYASKKGKYQDQIGVTAPKVL
jgi:dCTP deaminase